MPKPGSVEAYQNYQNCNYDVRAAFVAAVNDCQHLLQAIDWHVDEMSLHVAMFGEIDWPVVGDYAYAAEVLRDLAGFLQGEEA